MLAALTGLAMAIPADEIILSSGLGTIEAESFGSASYGGFSDFVIGCGFSRTPNTSTSPSYGTCVTCWQDVPSSTPEVGEVLCRLFEPVEPAQAQLQAGSPASVGASSKTPENIVVHSFEICETTYCKDANTSLQLSMGIVLMTDALHNNKKGRASAIRTNWEDRTANTNYPVGRLGGSSLRIDDKVMGWGVGLGNFHGVVCYNQYQKKLFDQIDKVLCVGINLNPIFGIDAGNAGGWKGATLELHSAGDQYSYANPSVVALSENNYVACSTHSAFGVTCTSLEMTCTDSDGVTGKTCVDNVLDGKSDAPTIAMSTAQFPSIYLMGSCPIHAVKAVRFNSSFNPVGGSTDLQDVLLCVVSDGSANCPALSCTIFQHTGGELNAFGSPQWTAIDVPSDFQGASPESGADEIFLDAATSTASDSSEYAVVCVATEAVPGTLCTALARGARENSPELVVGANKTFAEGISSPLTLSVSKVVDGRNYESVGEFMACVSQVAPADPPTASINEEPFHCANIDFESTPSPSPPPPSPPPPSPSPPPPTPPLPPLMPGITGDPHLKGGDGDLTDFKGEDNTVYNVLSASNFSVNVLFWRDA